MLGTSLLGIRSINHLQADRDKIVGEHVRSLESAQDLETELRHIRFHSFVYVMEMDNPVRSGKVARDQAAFERILGEIRARAGTDEEQRKVLDEIEAGYTLYLHELKSAAHMPVGPTTKEYLAWADAHPILRIVIPCEQLLKLNRKSMQETVEESAKRGRRASVWMILLGVMGRRRRAVHRQVRSRLGAEPVHYPTERAAPRRSRTPGPGGRLQLRLTAEGGNLQRDGAAGRGDPGAASAKWWEQAPAAGVGGAAGRAPGGGRPAGRGHRPRGPQSA